MHYRAALYLLPSLRSSERSREEGGRDEDGKGHARTRAANDLNSPKRAERNYSSPRTESRAESSLNFSHSFAGWTRSQVYAVPFFLLLSLTTSLPPSRFRNAVLKTHVPSALYPLPEAHGAFAIVFLRCRRRRYFLRFYLVRWTVSATSCCPAANWNLLSFQSPHTVGPRDRNDCAGKTFKWSLVELRGTVNLFASANRSIWNRYRGNVIEESILREGN